jgi:phage terminase large subunit
MGIELELNPQKKQQEALLMLSNNNNVRVLGYGGAKGGGKSWLVRAWQVSRRLKYPGTSGVIIRKSYPELLTNHIKPFLLEYPKMKDYWKKADKMIEFPNGSTLYFRHLQYAEDVYVYQGQAFEDIALDEATQHTEEVFTILRSSNRVNVSNFDDDRGIHPKMLLTFNPGGIGHMWVKRLFIDKHYFENENAEDYAFVQAFLDDNKRLVEKNPEYRDNLMALPDHLRRAYLEGDWNVFEGQFFQEFRESTHVVDSLYDLSKAPSNYEFRLTWDDGTRAPRAVYLLIQDNDGYVDVAYEYYKAGEVASEAAKNIVEDLRGMGILELVQKKGLFVYDPSMDSKNDQTGMASSIIVSKILGIRKMAGNNARVEGARMFREYLMNTEFNKPLIRIWRRCQNLIRTLPQLIYADNREDVMSNSEDHCLSGESEIWTSEGIKKIKNLCGQEGLVYSIDGELKKFYGVRKTRKNAEMVRVYFDDGFVDCTPDHLFLLDDGWKQAIDLDSLDSIRCAQQSKCYKQYQSRNTSRLVKIWKLLLGEKQEESIEEKKKVIKVERIGRADTYNLHVKDTNCFAINNGVIVHNSYDSVRYGLMSLTKVSGRLGGRRNISKNVSTIYKPLGGYRYTENQKPKRPDWLPKD